MEIRVTPLGNDASKQSRLTRSWLGDIGILVSLALIFTVAILISQRPLLFGDPYHVLACQLVAAGKKPYVDFFFQQTPLYPLICGTWLRIFGSSWYAANLLSALLVGGSATVLANLARKTFSESGWAVTGSVVTLLFFGLNLQLVRWGNVAQPYALCMLFCLLAWPPNFSARPARTRLFSVGLAGGAAVNTTMLSLPFLLVLTGWIAFRTAKSDRTCSLFWFSCGAAVASLPLIYLGILAPTHAWFGIVEYHLFHRGDGWTDIPQWNLREVFRWITSTQGVLLAFLSLAALPVLFERKTPTSMRHPLQFVASVSFSWDLFLSLPRPTFFTYYVLLLPYVCLLAAAGVLGMANRMWSPRWAPIFLVGTALLYSYEGVKPPISNWLSHAPDDLAEYEETARQVNSVTNSNDAVYADYEAIYAVARRLPPRGFEKLFSPAIELPFEELERVGLVAPETVDAQLRAGRFATAVLSKIPDGDRSIVLDPRAHAISQLYSDSIETKRHVIFWKFKLQPP
jgi:hypothetical protein